MTSCCESQAPVKYTCFFPGCEATFCEECLEEDDHSARRCDGQVCQRRTKACQRQPCHGERCQIRCPAWLGCEHHLLMFDRRAQIPTAQVQLLQPPGPEDEFPDFEPDHRTIIAPVGASGCSFCSALLCPRCAPVHKPGLCDHCGVPVCLGIPDKLFDGPRCGVKCLQCHKVVHVACVWEHRTLPGKCVPPPKEAKAAGHEESTEEDQDSEEEEDYDDEEEAAAAAATKCHRVT